MDRMRNGGSRTALPPKTPAPPPALQLRIKKVFGPPLPAFIAGIGNLGDRFFFRLEENQILAEVQGERCTLLLAPSAWEELCGLMKVKVLEFGEEELDIWYQLPLRGVRMLHWRGETRIVVAAYGEVLSALKHTLPD